MTLRDVQRTVIDHLPVMSVLCALMLLTRTY